MHSVQMDRVQDRRRRPRGRLRRSGGTMDKVWVWVMSELIFSRVSVLSGQGCNVLIGRPPSHPPLSTAPRPMHLTPSPPPPPLTPPFPPPHLPPPGGSGGGWRFGVELQRFRRDAAGAQLPVWRCVGGLRGSEVQGLRQGLLPPAGARLPVRRCGGQEGGSVGARYRV